MDIFLIDQVILLLLLLNMTLKKKKTFSAKSTLTSKN